MSIVTYNNRSIANISAIPGAAKSLTHIKTLTASSSATLSFVNGSSDVVLDSTYPIYIFKYIGIHPATQSNFSFQVDTGTNTNYNQTIQSIFFYGQEGESSDPLLAYGSGQDQQLGTGFQDLSLGIDSDGNDSNCCGHLHIFNPSSTTFAKQFLGLTALVGNGYYSYSNYSAGYFNTTNALTRFQFKMTSGNIDSGTITLYGIN